MKQQLNKGSYLAFPFRIIPDGPATSNRLTHVRQQIEQLLFTNPGERVFRPDFGVGVKALVFETNLSPLWEVTQRRLTASLIQALQGEADPRSIQVEVNGDEERLIISISYSLVALNVTEKFQISIPRS